MDAGFTNGGRAGQGRAAQAAAPLPDSPPAAPQRLAGLPYARMNGTGNAILVVDLRGSDAAITPEEARALAAAPGIGGFDQLMAVHDGREAGAAADLRILNRDGSPSGACGNGTRCVAWWLLRDVPPGGDRDALTVTAAGTVLRCRRLGPLRFSVDMGRPRFAAAEIPVIAADPAAVVLADGPEPFRQCFALGMGNPHAVFFVDAVEGLDLGRIGPPVEHAPEFPERVNVSFAQVLGPAAIRLRVWERGAGATLACGTGACATLVAAAATGRSGRAARVELPGGALDIEWRDDDHVVMSGPVEVEALGRLGDRAGAGA